MMNIWRRFVGILFWIGFILIASAPIQLIIYGITFLPGIWGIGILLAVPVYATIAFWQWDSGNGITLSERIKQLNNWIRAGAKTIPSKPPLDKQALYEAIKTYSRIEFFRENKISKEFKFLKIYKLGYSYKQPRRYFHDRDKIQTYCKIKRWWGWNRVFYHYEDYVSYFGGVKFLSSIRCKKKYNDQLVQLLEILTGEDSMSNLWGNDIQYDRKQEDGKMVEDAQYEVVNNELGTAMIEATDKRRGKHMAAIIERNEMVKSQMTELAKDLFTVSLYLRRQIVTIDNCKMAVELSVGRMLRVNMYLNRVGKDDKRLNWKEIMASMVRDRDSSPLISSIRALDNKKKWHLPFSKESSIQTSYSVTSGWDIDDKEFDRDFLSLLPTARMLVDEQLAQLHTETVADTEYLQVMFSEAEAELGDSQ